MQTQMQKEMAWRMKAMAESTSKAMEKIAFLAITKGTSVMYADRDQPDGDTLYICGVNCNGIKPSAADPLAQYMCPLHEAHCRVKAKDVRDCYKPRAIDEQIAQEVNRMSPSKAYNQMWGIDDDPEEWEET